MTEIQHKYASQWNLWFVKVVIVCSNNDSKLYCKSAFTFLQAAASKVAALGLEHSIFINENFIEIQFRYKWRYDSFEFSSTMNATWSFSLSRSCFSLGFPRFSYFHSLTPFTGNQNPITMADNFFFYLNVPENFLLIYVYSSRLSVHSTGLF